MTSFCLAVGLGNRRVAVWENKGSQKRSQAVTVCSLPAPAPHCKKEPDELSGRANAFHQVEGSLIPDLNVLGLA